MGNLAALQVKGDYLIELSRNIFLSEILMGYWQIDSNSFAVSNLKVAQSISK